MGSQLKTYSPAEGEAQKDTRMIGVMSIKIQKTKSGLHREFDYGSGVVHRHPIGHNQPGLTSGNEVSHGSAGPAILHLDS